MANFDAEIIMHLIRRAYELAINGLPDIGFESAEDLADDYRRRGGTPLDQANSLIRWQVAKCATSGFISGLPGFPLMPITIPVNFTSVIWVQTRMVAAVAHLGGHDVHSDQVQMLTYACLCGNGVKDVLKQGGIRLGEKIAEKTIAKVSTEAIRTINRTVGFRLMTKFGEKGILNLGKAVPVLGGFVGAGFDGFGAATVGKVARHVFLA